MKIILSFVFYTGSLFYPVGAGVEGAGVEDAGVEEVSLIYTGTLVYTGTPG